MTRPSEWFIPVILALESQKQEDLQVEANLVYIASSRPSRATLSQKIENQTTLIEPNQKLILLVVFTVSGSVPAI